MCTLRCAAETSNNRCAIPILGRNQHRRMTKQGFCRVVNRQSSKGRTLICRYGAYTICTLSEQPKADAGREHERWCQLVANSARACPGIAIVTNAAVKEPQWFAANHRCSWVRNKSRPAVRTGRRSAVQGSRIVLTTGPPRCMDDCEEHAVHQPIEMQDARSVDGPDKRLQLRLWAVPLQRPPVSKRTYLAAYACKQADRLLSDMSEHAPGHGLRVARC
jgi:hypothetical protein